MTNAAITSDGATMTAPPAHLRSGQYVNQDGGYRAFIPTPLPPNPPIKIEGELQTRLSKADVALGRLDGSIQTLPNPDLFVAMYIRKEAVLSSQIEGTQSSLMDVLAAEARVLSPGRPRDVDEVFNYVRAINYGLEHLEDLSLSVRLLREIHAQLLAGARGQHLTPGKLRRTQVWIGPTNCGLSEATFVPPPPDQVPKALYELERFLRGHNSVPLLVRVGLAHAQFETIHPFRDGNGRLGRLLITLMLCERRTLIKPVLYLSYFFKRHRQQYYDHLQAVRDHGAWESWLAFFLQGVLEVSEQAARTAREILILRERHRQVITDRFGGAAANGHRVLEVLYERPIISAPGIRDLLGISYQAANNLVSRFVQTGVLLEFTGQKRNRMFLYADYMNLFAEEPRKDG